MTDPSKFGVAADWPLADPRTPAQRERDRPAVRAQVRVLSDGNSDENARRALDDVLDRIDRRQRSAVDGQATRFARLVPDGRAARVLVAENQLVIDADDAQIGRLGTALTGYSVVSRVRRARTYRSTKARSVEAVRADAKRLRDEHGITATVNTVVPLGYVVKGHSMPGATQVAATSPGAGGGAPVRVAVVDTGITDQSRSDAWHAGILRAGTDPLNVLAPLDRNDWFSGHGTFAAGIVRQIAPGAEVAVYRFTTTDGLGTDTAAGAALIQAADEAAAAGRRLIVNASFGAPAVDGVPPVAMRQAVQYIRDTYPTVLIVASAGNDGAEEPLYPAAFGSLGVRAVGALNADLTGAGFSNRGAWVHCSAVGVGVVSTFVSGKLPPEEGLGDDVVFGADPWATWSGTSFSAPQISGAVAAMCGADAALSPRAAFDQLITGRPQLPGFGRVVHILPGTPT